MNLIEIFKTNVAKKREAKLLVEEMIVYFPHYKINFDLEDCDKILRVETTNGSVRTSSIISLLESKHIKCEVLNLNKHKPKNMKSIQKIAHFIEDVMGCNDDDMVLEMMEEDMYMSFIDFEDSKNKIKNGMSNDTEI
jgi:hypothetical protein